MKQTNKQNRNRLRDTEKRLTAVKGERVEGGVKKEGWNGDYQRESVVDGM